MGLLLHGNVEVNDQHYDAADRLLVLLAAERNEDQDNVQDLYDDDDIGPILIQEPFRDFRRQYPRPLTLLTHK